MNFKKALRLWVLTAVMIIAAAGTAFAGLQDFWLVNDSKRTIDALYIGPSTDPYWGDDILGRDLLYSGESTKIIFDRKESTRHWDLFIVLDNGDEAWLYDVDLYRVYKITYDGRGDRPFYVHY